jgi:light-regulated signal transduction histidine kinase (bacteriophytochrome)
MEENLRLWKHSVASGEPFQFVQRFRRADGVYRWHLSRACAMRAGDGISMWIGSNTDIHQEKQTLEKLQRTTEDLKHFAYAASHDLQEPLRMVTSYAQLLSKEYKGTLNEDADRYISYAVEGAQRMEALLRGLREYWQASERGENHNTPVDCNKVLNRALLNLQEGVTKSGAAVTHDSLPTVLADEWLLMQVFQNLVGNAVKYRSEKPPQVHISAVNNGSKEWVFSVQDNGIGIDSQFAEKIFIMFNRLHGSKYPGSGVGLALCRKVIERFGGRIWVESELGRGSEFRFTLPSVE